MTEPIRHDSILSYLCVDHLLLLWTSLPSRNGDHRNDDAEDDHDRKRCKEHRTHVRLIARVFAHNFRYNEIFINDLVVIGIGLLVLLTRIHNRTDSMISFGSVPGDLNDLLAVWPENDITDDPADGPNAEIDGDRRRGLRPRVPDEQCEVHPIALRDTDRAGDVNDGEIVEEIHHEPLDQWNRIEPIEGLDRDLV